MVGDFERGGGNRPDGARELAEGVAESPVHLHRRLPRRVRHLVLLDVPVVVLGDVLLAHLVHGGVVLRLLDEVEHLLM